MMLYAGAALLRVVKVELLLCVIGSLSLTGIV
jgi:hypothetical protein